MRWPAAPGAIEDRALTPGGCRRPRGRHPSAAELVENAALFSLPSTKVHLRPAARLRDGVLIEVDDSGFGRNEDMTADASRKIQSEKADLLDALRDDMAVHEQTLSTAVEGGGGVAGRQHRRRRRR